MQKNNWLMISSILGYLKEMRDGVQLVADRERSAFSKVYQSSNWTETYHEFDRMIRSLEKAVVDLAEVIASLECTIKDKEEQ